MNTIVYDKDAEFIPFFREYEEYGFLSNFAPYSFYYTMNDGEEIKFFTAEHAVHFLKALLFKDINMSIAIRRTWTPKEAKHLGRLVKNFDSKIWDENKEKIYHDVIKAKFTRNRFSNMVDLRQMLLDTGDAILVECSPYDRIWGIGYSKDSKEFINKEFDKWGQNLLGKILMNVRSEIK